MNDNSLEYLEDSDDYKKLLSVRRKTALPLAYAMLGVYYAYILVIAFKPEVFAVKIGDGHTTIGMITGLGVILFSFIITGIYVHKANTVLEPLTEKIHEKFGGR